MELRMWFIREKYKEGGINVQYMEGTKLPADKLTKLGNRSSHLQFRSDILGLSLIPKFVSRFDDNHDELETLSEFSSDSEAEGTEQ